MFGASPLGYIPGYRKLNGAALEKCQRRRMGFHVATFAVESDDVELQCRPLTPRILFG